MTPEHDGRTPPAPRLTAEAAVRRGHLWVTLPVLAIMLGLWGAASVVLRRGAHLPPISSGAGIALLAAVVIGPPALAWLWWAYTVPRWRHWALRRGADPRTLQELGQAQGLVWRKGSVFERTEFRHTPKK